MDLYSTYDMSTLQCLGVTKRIAVLPSTRTFNPHQE